MQDIADCFLERLEQTPNTFHFPKTYDLTLNATTNINKMLLP